MFCEKCGGPIKSGDKVCGQCGHAVACEFEVEQAKAEETQTVVEEPKKKKSKGKVFAVILVLALLVVGVGVAKGAEIVNAIRQSTMKPEEYYQYIEARETKELVSDIADDYGETVSNAKAAKDTEQSGTMDVTFALGERVLDVLKEVSGTDLSWLDKAGMTVDVYGKGTNFFYTGLSTQLGEKNLIGANMIWDLEAGKLYLRVPELDERYLLMDMESFFKQSMGMSLEEFNKILDDSVAMYDGLPDQKQVQKLLEKYVDLVVSKLTDVEKEEDVLAAGDVSQKCTVLTITVDEDTLEEIAELVIETALTDKELEEFVIAVAKQQNAEPETVYRELLNELEAAKSELNELDMDGEIQLQVWVDAKGEVVGRSFEYEEGYSLYSASYSFPKDGKKSGIEIAAELNGIKIKLEGSATKSGGKWDGAADLKISTAKLAEITFENAEFDERVTGTFVLSPGKMVGELLTGAGAAFKADELALQLDLDGTDKKQTIGVKLLLKEELLAAVDTAIVSGENQKVAIPEESATVNMEDAEAMAAYRENVNMETLLQILTDAGVPKELLIPHTKP